MSAGPTALRAGEHRRMRWKNGLGWTNEVAREPADEAAPFVWRVSVAEVDADCEFSEFAGVDRSILVLSGAGMQLRVGAAEATLVAGGPALAFAGEAGGVCRLLAGPTRDFNVMTRRGVCTHSLTRARVDGRLARAGGVGTTLVYVVAGRVTVAGLSVADGDCLRFEAGPGDRSDEAGPGDRSGEAGSGDRSDEAGPGDRSGEAGPGDRLVLVGAAELVVVRLGGGGDG